MQEDEIFYRALETGNRNAMRIVAKADLHNHAGLGYRRSAFEKKYGIRFPSPPDRLRNIGDMDAYIREHLLPHFSAREDFEFAVESAIEEAISDGVTLIETSTDAFFSSYYPNGVAGLSTFILNTKKKYNKEILFMPELGITREKYSKEYENLILACMETGAFKSIDLYGEELSFDAENFITLYRTAEDLGIKRKAHAGEFGDAKSVRTSCEKLRLNGVQHGIAAATDSDVLRFLRDNKITCHVCPTSNVVLSRTESLHTHPLRSMMDAGVAVTINTDDIFFFEQNVSDEFLNLFKTGLYSASELNEIRKRALYDETKY
ncbi:MAG: hypothetical protein V2A54_02685 [Bacteroidota bacterium]